VILLDSGNYERFWKNDPVWDVDQFHSICETFEHHLCFCFDNLEPPAAWDVMAADVVMRVQRDQKKAKGTVIPIVHGPSHLLPSVVRMVAEELYPLLVAVPERALGDGLEERVRTVRAVRSALDELGFYCPIHLLGTGNPISILVYALAGADTFDGLEWCKTVVDHDTGLLYHFHQWDLLAYQTEWGRKRVLPYAQSVLMHNLTFYTSFMRELRNALISDTCKSLLDGYLPRMHVDRILALAGGGK